MKFLNILTYLKLVMFKYQSNTCLFIGFIRCIWYLYSVVGLWNFPIFPNVASIPFCIIIFVSMSTIFSSLSRAPLYRVSHIYSLLWVETLFPQMCMSKSGFLIHVVENALPQILVYANESEFPFVVPSNCVLIISHMILWFTQKFRILVFISCYVIHKDIPKHTSALYRHEYSITWVINLLY